MRKTGMVKTGDRASKHDAAYFGFMKVSAREKREKVQLLFNRVAPFYDSMNDIMSFGIHHLWKKILVDMLYLKPADTVLDIGGGTGDIAMRCLQKQPCHVMVCDLSYAMVVTGRNRFINKGMDHAPFWVNGDAENLAVKDAATNICTAVFCLRNVVNLPRALSEIKRVLKPGGRFLCLEFSHIVLPWLDRLYKAYSFQVIPRMGKWIVQDQEAYQYLVESIRKFPSQENFCRMIESAGLTRVKSFGLCGGIAAIHMAWRL